MKSTRKICIAIGALLLAVILLMTGMWLGKKTSAIEHNPNNFAGDKAVVIGQTDIGEYTIVAQSGTSQAAKALANLIEQLTGKRLQIKTKEEGKNLFVLEQGNDVSAGEISISDGNVYISGTNKKECLENVYIFANRYLGYAFAGSDRQYILDGNDIIYVTANTYENDSPWIAEREPIVCLWKANTPRGQHMNINVDNSSEIMTFSNDQLYEYVKMMNYVGYTGIQVTDMCSGWAQYGSYQFVHEKLRFMADAAHSLGMKFTLWVWGAEFTGYGWVDDTVEYYDYSKYAYSYDDPKALATFEKYYRIYQEIADCADRVIMHFYDPSSIHRTEEVAYYAKMFREMVREVNPTADFGVSDYTNHYDKTFLKEALGDDFTVYCGTITGGETNLSNFRVTCLLDGINLGVWSWNICENEIDQLAQVSVNGRVIQDVYNATAEIGDVIKPVNYWSEMDSYHNANVFSLYCSGRLLQDRDLDVDDLYREISYDVAGEKYADSLYEIITLVEEARSGDDFSTFRYGQENYRLTSDDYPAEAVLEKCEKLIPVIEEMTAADLQENRIPLAISVTDLLDIYHTTLCQIKEFATFRVGLKELYALADKGASGDTLFAKAQSIYKAVLPYDSVVGVWGTTEAIAQNKLMSDFCEKYEIEMPEDKVYTNYLKSYLYGEVCAYQKMTPEKYVYDIYANLWPSIFGERTTRKLVNALIDDGLLVSEGEGLVSLANYKEIILSRH